MKPAAPTTRPRSSLRGTRITTNDSSPNCMMSSSIGSPVRTTSRMRLFGITSSTTRPVACEALASLSRAAYLSESHTMRASRSTMMAPSQIWPRPSKRDFLAMRRIAAGSLSRLTVSSMRWEGRFSRRPFPEALLYDGAVLAEQDAAFFLGADAAGARIHFLDLRVGALRPRACPDGGVPALQVGKVVDVLPLPIRHDPRIGRHVGDRVLLAHDEVAAVEAPVEHCIEAARLLHVALDGVGDLLRRVVREVMVLPGHGTQAAHLPEKPFDRLDL